jgi:nitrogen-specific signal transduction histidine kinase
VVVLEVETTDWIPLEIQENIFDPFFSTKEQGTGWACRLWQELSRSMEAL